MALINKKSKTKRYFGIALVSFLIGSIMSSYVYSISSSNIPREYLWGNFQLHQLPIPSDVHVVVLLSPENPTVYGQEILVTALRSDTLEEISESIVVVKDKDGNLDNMGFIGENSGKTVVKYAGEGTIIRVTYDGTWIRDGIVMLPPQEEWVSAAKAVHLNAILSGIVTGASIGIGLYFLFKKRRWL